MILYNYFGWHKMEIPAKITQIVMDLYSFNLCDSLNNNTLHHRLGIVIKLQLSKDLQWPHHSNTIIVYDF
jgi:hypothetical protein